MEKQCPRCGEELVYKKGFSKTKNKPYQGYFCPNKACGFVEWLPASPSVAQPKQASFDDKQYQTQPTVLENILETLLNIQKINQEMYKIDVALYKESLIKKSYGEKSSGDGQGEAVAGNGK
jgi:hypothetical protein